MYREQDNSHLERPDHTLYPSIPCTTLTIWVRPSSAIPWGHCHQTPQYSTDSSSRRASRVKIPSILSTVIFPGCGHVLEPSIYRVNGKGVNSSSALSSYKEGKATPSFHKPIATPMGRGRLGFKRNILVAYPGVRAVKV